MRKNLIPLATLVFLAVSAGTASAGGEKGSIGVGAEYSLLGIGGPSVNYDAGQFHVGGFLGYLDNDVFNDAYSRFQLGGRFYYHVHSTAFSDFSVGALAGLEIGNAVDPADDDYQDFYLDLGSQIRVFPGVSNVAFSFSFGFGFRSVDGGDDGFAITGDTVGLAGVHYYFI